MQNNYLNGLMQLYNYDAMQIEFSRQLKRRDAPKTKTTKRFWLLWHQAHVDSFSTR